VQEKDWEIEFGFENQATEGGTRQCSQDVAEKEDISSLHEVRKQESALPRTRFYASSSKGPFRHLWI